jgi:hypothetical protein
VTSVARKFLIGLHALRSPRELVMILLTSVAIWLTETGKYWVIAHAFPTLQVNFAVLMLMTAVVNLATTLPSAPGYVGTFDKPGIEVLKAFGQAPNVAAAYTIVLHVALWLPITILGFILMARESLRWRELEAVTMVEASQEVNAGTAALSAAVNGAAVNAEPDFRS